MTISITQECLIELERQLLQKPLNLSQRVEIENRPASDLLGLLFDVEGTSRAAAEDA